jgi:hypothetical protein
MYIGLHVKYPLLLSDFNETCIYREIFEKSSSIKFHENPSSEVELLHTVRRKDKHDEANSRFRNFANAPKTALFLAHLKTRPSQQGFMKQTCPSVQAVFFLQYTL